MFYRGQNTDLFRFVTVRNPQLLTEDEKETGLPCCHNENEEDNLAYGHSVMHGKDEDVEP